MYLDFFVMRMLVSCNLTEENAYPNGPLLMRQVIGKSQNQK